MNLKEKRNKERIMSFFGALADKGINWDEKEKRMKKFRESIYKRMQEIRLNYL